MSHELAPGSEMVSDVPAKVSDTSAPKSSGELSGNLWAFRRELLLVGALSALANLLMLTPTIYLLQIFDRIMVSQNTTTLLAVSVITFSMFLLLFISESVRSRILVGVSVRLDERLSTRVFNASFDAQMAQRARISEGGPGRSFNDLIQIRQFVTGQGVFAFFDAPWIPIYIAVCWLLHPALGITALIFAGIQFLLAWFGHARTVRPVAQTQLAQGEASAFVLGKLRQAETLESMGMLPALKARWQERYHRYLGFDTRSADLSHRMTALSKFVRYVQQSAALAVGAVLVIHGEISAGAMIAANILVNRALAPIDLLVNSWRPFLMARDSWNRLSGLLHAHPERAEESKLEAPKGQIILRKVSVSVAAHAEPILQEIDLDIRPGEVWVVLGPSGSGKSTLARVLLGICPGVRGEVLLDQRPIQDWSREALGPFLGYLPQDIELFEGTVAENIARGGEPDPEKVIEATRSCGLHEMLLRLPQGYDTPIGEAGQKLSGGQRQRLALARALYGHPRIVVLDEPNANLDEAGEAALARTVDGLRQEHVAVVLITHRSGAIALADHLLVLQRGRIRLKGPRETVLAQLKASQVAQGPQAA
jgi:ATP-binding cassette subfamily C exporter for protease/lipase